MFIHSKICSSIVIVAFYFFNCFRIEVSNASSCRVPSIANGTIFRPGLPNYEELSSDSIAEPGVSVLVICYAGFALQLENRVISLLNDQQFLCFDTGTWFYNLTAAECIQSFPQMTTTQASSETTDCGNPPAVDNGYIKGESTNVDASQRIMCNIGYAFNGTNHTIICEASGQWSSPTGTCVNTTNLSLMTAATNVTSNFSDYETWFDAVYRNDLQQVKLAIREGADCNAEADSGIYFPRTALHDCSWYGYVAMAQLLLNEGANVDARAVFDWTPLMIACWNGEDELYQVYVEHGADVNAKDENGDNCLIFASRWGNEEIVHLLLRHPRFNSLNEKNNNNKTALQYTLEGRYCSPNCESLSAFLKSHGASMT